MKELVCVSAWKLPSVTHKQTNTYIFKIVKEVRISESVVSRNMKVLQFLVLVDFDSLFKLCSSLQNVN